MSEQLNLKSVGLMLLGVGAVIGAIAFAAWWNREPTEAEERAAAKGSTGRYYIDAPAKAPTNTPVTVTPIVIDAPAAVESNEPYTDEQRNVVAINLTKLMRDNGAELGFQADGVVLLAINLSGGGCNREGLRALVDLVDVENFQKAGFTKIKCSPRGGEIAVPSRAKPSAHTARPDRMPPRRVEEDIPASETGSRAPVVETPPVVEPPDTTAKDKQRDDMLEGLE